MPLTVAVGDITQLDVDIIVNAANEALTRGGGVCGAIFRAAGPRLIEACARAAPCPTGDARMTPGFDAKARWIVHAVGPIWRGGAYGEAALLESAYHRSLELAKGAGAASIAFPAISTGIYGYPKEEAAQIAVSAVLAWRALSKTPEEILFCCFSESDAEAYRRELGKAPRC